MISSEKNNLAEKRLDAEKIIFGQEHLRRYTQDSPILPDVWIEYFLYPGKQVDLLFNPYGDMPAGKLFKILQQRLNDLRSTKWWKELHREETANTELAFNQSAVVARLYFDELIAAALPLTKWWKDRVLSKGVLFKEFLNSIKTTSVNKKNKNITYPLEWVWIAEVIGKINYQQTHTDIVPNESPKKDYFILSFSMLAADKMMTTGVSETSLWRQRMHWYYNLKIKSKLLIAFIFTLSLTVVVGYTGYNGMEKIIPSFKSLYDDRLIPVLDLSEAVQNLYSMRLNVLRHYTANDNAEMLAYQAEIDNSQKIIADLIDKYSKTYLVEEEAETLKDFKAKLKEYYEARNISLTLSLAMDKTGAIANINSNAGPKFKEALVHGKELIAIQEKVGKQLFEESHEIFQSASLNLLFITIAAVIFGLTLALFIASKISSKVRTLAEHADKVSRGDLSVEIEAGYSDEVGKLSNSLKIMVQNIKKGIEELQAEKAGVEKKVEEAVKLSEAEKKYLSENVEVMLSAIDKFSNGDLCVSLHAQKEDEIGKLFNGFNIAVKNVKELIAKVGQAIHQTVNSSGEISSSTEQMAAGAQEQSSQTGEVATAVEQMTKE